MRAINNIHCRRKQCSHDRGFALHEVLVASSILTISISGYTTGIIRSNSITHQGSLRKAAESVMTDDLETTIKRHFYTYRCHQGPCKTGVDEVNKNLMYYDLNSETDKKSFKKTCESRTLAKDLLGEQKNGIAIGEKSIKSEKLKNAGISITRKIALDEQNQNKAIVSYTASKAQDTVATIKTVLIPNAVYWCS